MAQCAQSAQEFIQNAFGPMVAVLCSHDAEVLCQKNNLSFVEMVRPFCKLNTEAHIRDPAGQVLTLRSLKIIVNEMNMQPPSPTIVRKMMNEAVSNAQLPQVAEGSRTNVLSVGDYDLQISSSTPWYEAYRELFLHVAQVPSTHEYLKHFIACLLVVSSSHADPMDQFIKLSTQQNQHQFNSKTSYPKWFNNNIFKYYVLVHDVAEGDEEKADGVYQSMKSSFGTHACHLLKINSRPMHTTTEASEFTNADQGSLPNPWSQFISKKIDSQEQGEGEVSNSVSGAADSSPQIDHSAFPSKVSEADPGPPVMNTMDSQPLLTRVESEPLLNIPDRDEPSLIRVGSAIHMTAGVPHISSNNINASLPQDVENKETLLSLQTQHHSTASTPTEVFSHPLSPENEEKEVAASFNETTPPTLSAERTTPPPPPPNVQDADVMNKLNQRPTVSKSSLDSHGVCLTLSDHDRLRIFIHEFTVRGLLGYIERQIRVLSEQLASRKAIHRSIFSATKKWFGGNKPSNQASHIQSTVGIKYPPESPENQMRRLGDLSFLVQNYELAYQSYHSAKRDYNNDNAWMHYAGALEMAAQSLFMQGNSQRPFPSHYMENCITTYLGTCKNAHFATRATILSTEILKAKNMYAEAAMQFIRMTSEDSDLRSALLLEQAAHCFINMKLPMVRKYAFHMILAGHRYSKSGQRKHALRSYSQALQVYKGKAWTLAEDHINFTIGRQSFNLKQLDNATAAFKHLLTNDSRQTPPQQAAFLREYLFVFKQQLTQATSDGSPLAGILPQLPLPLIDKPAIKVLLGSTVKVKLPEGKTTANCLSFDQVYNADCVDRWKDLEELAVSVSSRQNSLPSAFKPTVQLFSEHTYNDTNPIAVVGEPVSVEIVFVNPLKIPLVLTDLSLIWKFSPMRYLIGNDENPEQQSNVISNESGNGAKMSLADTVIDTQVIQEFVLAASEKKSIVLTVTPQQTGELHIMGVGYSLGTTSPPNTQSANAENKENVPNSPMVPKNPLKKPSYVSGITVRGRQDLDVQGPRLNTSKNERSSIVYGPDRRLDPIIAPPMPLLNVIFSKFPTSMLCGEVQQTNVEFINRGKCALHKLFVSSKNPEFFTFGLMKTAKQENQQIYRTLRKDESNNEHVCKALELSFVTQVPLPDGQLLPDSSVTLPMWVRGAETAGTHQVEMLFYYESVEENAKMRHRVLHHTVTVQTSNSICLKTTAKRGCAINKESKSLNSDDSLLVSLEIENMNQVHDSTITEFSIEQVSCASKQWSLLHLSTDHESDIKINPRETCFGEEVVFTNVMFNNSAQINSSMTPCSDFYFWSKGMSPSVLSLLLNVKSTSSTPKDILTPDTDTDTVGSIEDMKSKLQSAVDVGLTVIVLWKAFVVTDDGSCQVITGQHHVPISVLDQQESSQPVSKTMDLQPPIKFIKQIEIPKDDDTSDELLSQLVQYTMEYNEIIQHDFSRSRLCLFTVQLHLHNCSQSNLQVIINTVNGNLYDSGYRAEVDDTDPSTYYPSNVANNSAYYTWVGQNSVQMSIASSQSRTVQLRACFSKPGLYNLGRISVCILKPEFPTGVRNKRRNSQDSVDAKDAMTTTGAVQSIRQRQSGPYLVTVNDTST
uniref:Trafficking protein particle complex subunit 8-like n=1 Tax=Saccoglossus kowalevskii TaxID=10224 RepID=A0ABM0MAB7_SACKO|nr:PREDICTED: trafficking protein particle complex subunit 8-like [Saccoglossus kowalevskii]